MYRLGLFGGSFDPPHLGHQALILRALETVPMDSVWVAPAFVHPEKSGMSPYDDRLEMTNLMLQKLRDDRLHVSTFERAAADITKGITAGLVDLIIENYARTNLEVQVVLLVGADVKAAMPKWYGYDDLVKMQEAGHLDITALPRGDEISSTDIRSNYAHGTGYPNEKVPAAVHRYVLARGLYRAL